MAVVEPIHAAEERDRVIDFVLALRKSRLVAFLRERDLPRSGAKHELRASMVTALEDGRLGLNELVDLLDRVTPWGKQHARLLGGMPGDPGPWRDRERLRARLAGSGAEALLDGPRRLLLPPELTLSRLEHDGRRLRATAVQRRDYWERRPDLDRRRRSEGVEVEHRAFAHHVTRNLVAFEWDLEANHAMLQIGQLSSGEDYDATAGAMADLMRPWLPLEAFEVLDVARAIPALHALEEEDRGETRSHRLSYATLAGRRLTGSSPDADSALIGGEDAIDAALGQVRAGGVGHIGNFYWLPCAGPPGNPLTREVHVVIVGAARRVSFPAPNDEEVVRHVLSRIRSLCD